MWLQKPKIYDGSCGQVGNLNKGGKHPKATPCSHFFFFDLEKAYETTWRYGIMKDLRDMELKGRLPNFMKSFLSDRKFRVRIGSTLTDIQNQEEGVPQGGVLSVTLFDTKINSITNCLNPG